MQCVKSRSVFRLVLNLTVLGVAPFAGVGVAAENQDAVTVGVEDASARVGEKATIVAKITPRDGYKIAEDYRNRISMLSAADDGVEFESKVVRGSMQNGDLVFGVRVTLKKPGAHAINGVLRFGIVYSLDGNHHLDMKWVPLMATVTGTE